MSGTFNWEPAFNQTDRDRSWCRAAPYCFCASDANFSKFSNFIDWIMSHEYILYVIDIIYVSCKCNEIKREKNTPRRGIEPRSPAWQAGILTTILSWSYQVLSKSSTWTISFLLSNFAWGKSWSIIWPDHVGNSILPCAEITVDGWMVSPSSKVKFMIA